MSASSHRKKLVSWVLSHYGDGSIAPCAGGCGILLTCETVTLDRYPVPGRLGGAYVRHNVRPMCQPCNNGHVDEPGYAEMIHEHLRQNEILRQSFQEAVDDKRYAEHFDVESDGKYKCRKCDTRCLSSFNAAAHWMIMHVKYEY